MKRKYSALLFDADNTLLDFNKDERQALIKTFTEYSVPVNEENIQIYTEINKALWKQFEKGEITKPELKKTRFRRFFEKAGIETEADSLEVNERYLFLLGELGGNIFDGADRLLEKLKKAGYEIYIVTNGVALTQAKRLTHSGLLPCISEVFVSEALGYQKPRREYFQQVFEKITEKDKAQILLIGDSLTSDIQGAMNSGIDSVWFNLFHDISDGQYKPTYTITELCELEEILL